MSSCLLNSFSLFEQYQYCTYSPKTYINTNIYFNVSTKGNPARKLESNKVGQRQGYWTSVSVPVYYSCPRGLQGVCRGTVRGGYLSVGAVKQREMTNLLCAHFLPANRIFQNRKSGWSTRSFVFYLAKESRQMGEIRNGKIRTMPAVCKNNYKLL